MWQPARLKEAPVAAAPSGSAEIARIRASMHPDEWTRADFDAITPTIDRLIQAYPENGEAWALRSIANSLLVVRNLDSGTKPLEVGKEAADRARRLVPDSPLAELSLGLHLVAMISRGGDPLACRPHIDKGLAGLPADENLTRYAELCSYWLGYQIEGTERVARAWLAKEPRASFPAWILAQSFLVRRRPVDAEKWATQAAADTDITGVRSLVTLFESRYYLQADLGAARAALDRISGSQRGVHRVVAVRWLLAMAEKQYDLALQELARTPESMLRDRIYHGPKALLAAFAHEAAGRAEAAQVQFRDAETALRAELANDPENRELRAVLALNLACLGRADDARRELAEVEPLLNGQSPSVYVGEVVALIAQAYGVLGETDRMVPWLRYLLTNQSQLPFSPASLRLDQRFGRYASQPQVQALLAELAGRDQPAAKTDDKSVAVLAFANLSDDKDNEYFSDGISEELLNVLAKIPELKVAARTSAFYFKGKEVPVPEIARQLGVAYVVEGSVRKQGTKVRITAQLIKAADGFHVWSDTFTRELKDIFAVQDEIAGLIAKNLELKMGMAKTPVGEINPEAYQEYLVGRAAVAKAGMPDLREAVTHFERSVAVEPKFTAAWVQLASAHTQLGRWGGAPTLESWKAARAAIDQAKALEPDSPDVLLALGWIRRTADWDWRGAEQAFRRAMQLRPNHPDTLSGAAVLLFNIGKKEEAFQLGKQAALLDPLNAATQIDLSLMFYLSERWAESERLARRALQLAPGGAGFHSILAWSLVEQRRYAEAETEATLDTDEINQATALGMLAIARGQGVAARGQLARFEQLARTDGDSADLQQGIATISASLGENDHAFAALEKARASRDPSVSWLRNEWRLRPLFSDPRWPVLLHQVGLADDQLK